MHNGHAFHGTIQTDGVAGAIVKTTLHNKPGRQKVDPNVHKKPEPKSRRKRKKPGDTGTSSSGIPMCSDLSLGDWAQLPGQLVYVDPGQRQLLYMMGEHSTAEALQVLHLTQAERDHLMRTMTATTIWEEIKPLAVWHAEQQLLTVSGRTLNRAGYAHFLQVRTQVWDIMSNHYADAETELPDNHEQNQRRRYRRRQRRKVRWKDRMQHQQPLQSSDYYQRQFANRGFQQLQRKDWESLKDAKYAFGSQYREHRRALQVQYGEQRGKIQQQLDELHQEQMAELHPREQELANTWDQRLALQHEQQNPAVQQVLQQSQQERRQMRWEAQHQVAQERQEHIRHERHEARQERRQERIRHEQSQTPEKQQWFQEHRQLNRQHQREQQRKYRDAQRELDGAMQLYRRHPWTAQPVHRKLRLNAHINKRRMEDRLARAIRRMFGVDPTIILGNWSAGMVRGHKPIPGKGLRKMLKRLGFRVYHIDEYKTSTWCPFCKDAELEKFLPVDNPREHQRPSRPIIKSIAVLRCSNANCLEQDTNIGTGDQQRRILNRDLAAVLNFQHIVEGLRTDGTVPDQFCRSRPETTGPPAQRRRIE
ncbi:hypothetical protein IWW50_001185 [Coemansia erecta]|nr:hypothetical protein IWW50_001185 [Coemansia erecta]